MADDNHFSPAQRRALARLSAVAEVRSFYLAGGTAIAFYFGHRISRDLDFFSFTGAIDLEALQRGLVTALPDVEVIAITDATLQVRLEGIPIDLVRYRYQPLEPTHAGPVGINVAGQLDLAVMKLAAIAHRGLRRDFWDMHEMVTRGTIAMDTALDAYKTRFGKAEPDLYHVLRALTFFDDAEAEPLMPAGLTPEHWQRIRVYFEMQIPAILQRRFASPDG